MGLRRLAHELALTEGHQLEASIFRIQLLSVPNAASSQLGSVALLPNAWRGLSQAPAAVQGRMQPLEAQFQAQRKGFCFGAIAAQTQQQQGPRRAPWVGGRRWMCFIHPYRGAQPPAPQLEDAWMQPEAALLPNSPNLPEILPAPWVPAWALSRAQARCGEGRAEKPSPLSVPADSGSRETQRLLTAPCYTPRGLSGQARALLLSLHTLTPSGIRSDSPKDAEFPPTLLREQLDPTQPLPSPGSLRAARGTFGLGVVHRKHVDGHELEHAGAADGRGAVLQQDLELPQDLFGHRRERLHPARREREAGERRLCPRGGWHSSLRATFPKEWGPPQLSGGCLPSQSCGESSPRSEGAGGARETAEAFLREGSEGLLCKRQAAFLWQEHAAFLSHF